VERGGDRLKRRCVIRGLGDRGDEHRAKLVLAVEDDLAFIGEVAKEGALGESCARGDLGDCGLFVAVLEVQLERSELQAPARVRLPSSQAPMLSVDSDLHQVYGSCQ
jgi:hypothetical protein